MDRIGAGPDACTDSLALCRVCGPTYRDICHDALHACRIAPNEVGREPYARLLLNRVDSNRIG